MKKTFVDANWIWSALLEERVSRCSPTRVLKQSAITNTIFE